MCNNTLRSHHMFCTATSDQGREGGAAALLSVTEELSPSLTSPAPLFQFACIKGRPETFEDIFGWYVGWGGGESQVLFA